MERVFARFLDDVEKHKSKSGFHYEYDMFGITPFERLALWVWSLSLFPVGEINSKLRLGQDLDEEESVFIGLLDAAVCKIPVTTAEWVIRGLTYQCPGESIPTDFAQGTTHVWSSFTSATLDTDLAYSGNLLMLIQPRTARPIMAYSEDFLEQEVLFRPGARLVSEGGWIGKDRYVVRLREV